MTSTTAETTTPAPSKETTDLFDSWLATDGPVALRLRQKLLPVEADETGRGVIFPPTYADIGYNIDTLADGTRVATIDTVGSQANRLEPIFKKASEGQPNNPLASLVPQIEIVLHKAGGKKGNKRRADAEGEDGHIEKRSLLDLAHRSADAVVLASPTLAPEIAKAFEALRNTGNLVALRGIRGEDAGETTEVQKYLLGLALLAATADLELFLREGCLLRYANEDTWTQVPRRGEPAEVSLPTQDQLVAYAKEAAAPFKAKWPKDKEGSDLPLEHEFNLTEAKKLLAKQVDEGPASEQPKQ